MTAIPCPRCGSTNVLINGRATMDRRRFALALSGKRDRHVATGSGATGHVERLNTTWRRRGASLAGIRLSSSTAQLLH